MPQRLIQPAVSHMKSPITLRGIMAFLAFMLLGYLLLTDFQRRQASAEQLQVLDRYIEEARLAVHISQNQQSSLDMALRNQSEMLQYMRELNQSVGHLATIVQAREAPSRPTPTRTPPAKPKKTKPKRTAKTLSPCYELRPSYWRQGNNTVTTTQYVQVRCE